MEVDDLLRENGIRTRSTAPGRYYTTCPRCSAGRKGAHRPEKVLGVTIETDGVHWGCNHCSWTGPEKGSGKANGHDHTDRNIYYDYLDENGKLLFRKVRTHDKRFWQERPDGRGGWIRKLGDTRKVIYRLPEVNEAIANGYRILVVEGEKDADNLWRINVPATCNPDGASEPGKKPKWRPEYSEMLRGADVVVMNDNDAAGRAHAEAVAQACAAVAASVRLVDIAKHWPECPKGGDVSDWLAAGHTREQLDTLIEKAGDAGEQAPPPIITLDEWLSRDLPQPDRIMGQWLTTTSRAILNAATGLGKSMFGIGLGMAASANSGFCHWGGVRLCNVLYIDGEMSRRLLKTRLVAETERLGVRPIGFHALSHEDIPDFAPLNTKEGQAIIEREIKRIGTVDLIIFDNIMSLIAGDMKDEESWSQILPWVRSLTARGIGQLWIHHTGHNENRGYGTSTREWQMDTVLQLDRVERPDTDVSFQLKFTKARERTPATRQDFAETKIALVNDAWTCKSADGKAPGKVSPRALKFEDALRNATISDPPRRVSGCPAAKTEEWRAECVRAKLIDPEAKAHSARTLFSKYRLELIAANRVACNETMAWTLT